MELTNIHRFLLFLAVDVLVTVSAQFSAIPFADRAEQLSRNILNSSLSTLREPLLLIHNSTERLRELNLTEPFIDYSVVNASAVAQEIAAELSDFFKVRKDALMAAVREAENIVQNHTTVTKIENVDTYFSLEIKEQNWKVPSNFTPSREFKCDIFETASTAYVTRDVYFRAPHIVNGLAWSTRMDRVWKENRERLNITGWQYFGSRSGFVRVYPGYKWMHAEGEENTYNPAYDIRRFPWYGQGVTSPKDVLILIDTSGSVYGQPLQYMKIAAFNFLDTLSENDFVNIMTFNMQAQLVTPLVDTFLPASERNKRMLRRYLETVQPLNQAMYAGAFESAFKLFDGKTFNNATEFLKNGFGANCNQMIVLLSDGGTEFPHEVFKDMNWNRRAPQPPDNDTLRTNVSMDPEAQAALKYARSQRRIFAYALGQQQNPTTALKKIACTNRGTFKHILDIGAIKTVLERYVEVLQRPMLEKMENPVTFSHRYFEQDGMGYVVSVLAPVYNRTDEKDEDGYTLSSVLGLMANDISLTQIMNDTIVPISRQLGSSGYAFLIDHNGFALIHPRLHPMDDLLALSGGNLKDRQVNDGVDFLDLEYDDEARRDIRRRMIDGESGTVTLENVLMRCTHNDTALYHATVTYSFTPIKHTPFRVGVVVLHRGIVRRTVSFVSSADKRRPGDDSLLADAADEQHLDAASRLFLAAFDALELPIESRITNGTISLTHYHSMTVPTQVEFCKSLPTAPWSTKVTESATEAPKSEDIVVTVAPETTSNSTNGTFESEFEMPSEPPKIEEDVDELSTTTTTTTTTTTVSLVTDEPTTLSPEDLPGDESEDSDSIGSDAGGPGSRDDEALAFLRFVYSHFDNFRNRLKHVNETENITDYIADCGSPETYQLLVDAVAMQPIVNEWMSSNLLNASFLINSSNWLNTSNWINSTNLTFVENADGIISKLLISAHSLVAGFPKNRFDEYLAKSWFSPLARHSSLYDTASLALPVPNSIDTSADSEFYMHFEIIRGAGEAPRLFVVSPLHVPVPKMAQVSLPPYVMGVAAVEVNATYVDRLLDDSVPECHGDALCYLIDEFGYIVASSALAHQTVVRSESTSYNSSVSPTLVGLTLLEVNAPLFLALLHDGLLLRSGFYFTQEKCESPSQLAGSSAGNSPFSFAFWSRLFSFASMHVSQLLTTSFWTDSFSSLFSSHGSLFLDFADAAGPSKGRKGGRKSKKRGAATQASTTEEEDERRCVLNITRFLVNRTALERDNAAQQNVLGKFKCDGNCEKAYSISSVPGTSLFLVMTATNFTCSIVRHTHSTVVSSSNESDWLNSNLTEETTSSVTINFTVNSYDANCAMVNGVMNTSMLMLDPEHPIASEGASLRLEIEVKVGDGVYATRMRQRYRRRPQTCYDYWVHENPNCGAWSLFSTTFSTLILCHCVLLVLRRFSV